MKTGLVVVSYWWSGALQGDIFEASACGVPCLLLGCLGRSRELRVACLYTCCHKSLTTIFYGVYFSSGSSWNNMSLTTLGGLTKPQRNFKHGTCKLKKNATKKQLYKNIIEKLLSNIYNIYNMGNFPLTVNQIAVLNKGMSFVGAPEEVFSLKCAGLLTVLRDHCKPSNWQPSICKSKVFQDFF